MNDAKHIICYSGGHSSALVAIEVCRRFGQDNVILLNHNININYENEDIKRFKKEVADYLGLAITYANYNDLPLDQLPSQFEVCLIANSFVNPHTRQALCTHRLKTLPFKNYLEQYHPEKHCIIYYGFDRDEPQRIERRKIILNDMGYVSDYPLGLWGKGAFDHFVSWLEKTTGKADNLFDQGAIQAILEYDLQIENRDDWELTIKSTKEIGVEPPNAYDNFKHANCTGCLKGGKQHWYVVYCIRYDIYEEAKDAEQRIGNSIIKGYWLKDLEKDFKKMKCAGIEPSEHIPPQKFWKRAKKYTKPLDDEEKPCLCVF